MPYRESPRVENSGIACFYCGCLVLGGACPSCMAEMQRAPGPVPAACRRCGRGTLAKNSVGHGCSSCGGVFIGGDEWDRIVQALRTGGTVDHATIVPPPPGAAPKVDILTMVPCPCCGAQMERTPFAARSSIQIDVCSRHGIWIDSGELVGIIEVVRRLWKENHGHILSGDEKRETLAERELLRVQIEADVRREEERRREAQRWSRNGPGILPTLLELGDDGDGGDDGSAA